MPIPFLAQEISGLAAPTYNSGATNKKYVDDQITAGVGSGAITYASGLTSDSSVYQVGDATNVFLNDIPEGVIKSGSNWSKAYASAQIALYVDSDTYPGSGLVTLSSGLTADDNIYAIGEATDMFLDDIPESVLLSGSNWSKAFASSNLLDDLAFMSESDIDEVGTIGTGVWEGTAVGEGYIASGAEYQQAYQSSQLLKEGAFQSVSTGWFNVSDQSVIPHGLGSIPEHVTLTPSGVVTYATSFTVDATNITVRVSHAGQRTINWRAEV